jgi:small subunit ribosomal protein S21
MTEVIIGQDDRLDLAIKKFRRKVQRSGILADLRRKRHYEKPSDKRKRKANAVERRRRQRATKSRRGVRR